MRELDEVMALERPPPIAFVQHVQSAHSPEEIGKIWGGNVLWVLRDGWGRKEKRGRTLEER